MPANQILAQMAVQISANTAQFNAALRDTNTRLTAFQKTVVNVGKFVAGYFGTTQIFRGLQAGISIIAEFEAKMAGVRAISGATADEFNALKNDALQLGKSTQFTASQIAGLQTEFARLGFTVPEILAATKATTDLATATGEDLSKATVILGSSLRQFNLPASESAHFADVMTGAFNKTALALDDFGEAMKYAGPQASAANVSFEETSALLGILANAGIKGSQAGTSLRRILADLAKDGRPLVERLQELAAKGITVQGALDEVGRVAATSLIVLERGANQIQPLTDAFKDMTGEAARVSDIMRDNLSGDFTKLTGTIQSTIAEGTIFSDILRTITQSFTAFLQGLTSDKISNFEKFARILGTIASLGGVGTGLGLGDKFRQLEAEQKQLTDKAREMFLAYKIGFTDISAAAEEYQVVQTAILIKENQWLEALEKQPDASKASIEQLKKDIALRVELLKVTGEYIRAIAKQPEVVTPKVRIDVNYYEEKIKELKELQKTSTNRTVWEDYGDQITVLGLKLRQIAPTLKDLKRETEISTFKAPEIPKGLQIDSKGLDVNFPSVEKLQAQADALYKIDDAYMKVSRSMRVTQLVTLEFSKTTGKVTDIIINWGQALKDVAAQAISSFADSLGKAIAGQKDFGKTFLEGFAGFLKQFGELLIAAGVAKIAADVLLETPAGGYAAVAAGVALVALASFMTAKRGAGAGSAGSVNVNRNSASPGYGGALNIQGSVLVRGQDLFVVFNNYQNGRSS